MKIKWLALTSLITIAMAACSSQALQPSVSPTSVKTLPTQVQPTPTGAASVAASPEPKSGQIANPASKYCIEKGGKLDIRKDAAGNEFGMCVFPNGRECEEWALMRGQCSAEVPADKGANLASYASKTYGFSLTYPNTWSLADQAANGDQPAQIKLTRGNNQMIIQVKRASERLAFGAVAPQGGEIFQLGVLTVLGQKVPVQVVRLEGNIKSCGASFATPNLQFRFQLDNSLDPEIPGDVLQEAQTIVQSLQLTQ